MKKFQFILSVFILTVLMLCFVVLTFITIAWFVSGDEFFYFVDVYNSGAFALVFLLSTKLFAPTVRELYDEWKDGVE